MGETAKKICLVSLKSESNLVKSTAGRTNPELDLKLGLSNTYSAGNDQPQKNLIVNATSTTPASSINLSTNQTYERETIEIEKNIAEGNRLRKLRMNQLKGIEDAKRESDCGLRAINEQLDLNL
ncbi:hypothetical protein VIGAN_05177400 [Vigna angularis var. angularis]|uniref:Uncharacterized protein n=1 Tax=Vigna angularis var. angularis TaxID=157739 RepID=A0A0S3S676_PHAAN|nr:hypothetical protein VIGAN_05177400 [Vigna angularis var. angularis]